MRPLFLALLCGLFALPCHADTILSIAPSSQTVSLGYQVSFDLNISGLGNGTALGVYDIDFSFDSKLLSYSSVTFGNQLDLFGLGDVQGVTPYPGMVRILELSLDSISDLNTLQMSAFPIAKLYFDTVAVGTDSPVDISINALGDASGNSINGRVQGGTFSVISPVPEPNLIWVSSAALVVVLFLQRVKNPKMKATDPGHVISSSIKHKPIP